MNGPSPLWLGPALRRSAAPLVLLALLACSSDPAAPSDTPADAAAPSDAGKGADDGGGAIDGGGTPSDAGAQADDGGDAKAPPGDGGGCHALGFGGAPVTMVKVVSLPAMTGGAIPLGSYDAVEAKTTGTLLGTYRGSWTFETATTLQVFEQLALSGTPPTPKPRTLSYSTSGVTLSRQQICGGTDAFTNDYSVRAETAGTFLDVQSGGLLFTFKKR